MVSDSRLCWPPHEHRVVLTLLGNRACMPLSPFYALTPWIGVADLRGRVHRIVPGPGSNAEDLTARIIEWRPRLLICGFVPDETSAKLRSAGIDVRIGPCSESAVALVRRYASLPTPGGTREGTYPATHSL